MVKDYSSQYKSRNQMWKEKAKARARQFGKISVEDFDQMDGIQFEKALNTLFTNWNYEVEETPTTGDQGVDLIIKRDKTKIAIQAKRHAKSIGNETIGMVNSGKTFYRCNYCVVITTSDFTKKAKELAISLGVSLVNRRLLIDLLTHQSTNNFNFLQFILNNPLP